MSLSKRPFTDKRVLVTGGAGGIGLSTARAFAEAGAEIVLTDVDGAGLDRAAESLCAVGAVAPVHVRICDVTDRAQVEDVARWVLTEVGGLDVLVNNAGIGHHGGLASTSYETWERLMNVNFWGALHHVQAFLPHMTERGSGQIANISSGQAFFRLPTWGAYTAAKCALAAYSEVLHFELRHTGIHVTTIYPFMVDTPFYAGVEGETLGSRLSMKLLPLYSMKPDKVGRRVFDAVRKKKRVENISVLNDIGQLASVAPTAPTVIGRMANWLLAKR